MAPRLILPLTTATNENEARSVRIVVYFVLLSTLFVAGVNVDAERDNTARTFDKYNLRL